ncbi:hypothetical protein SCB49_01337 [unidentified eubacterium SCB49]|nr:hypothetical protein SCB49_01337 [unidentified eubacterium SCB49]
MLTINIAQESIQPKNGFQWVDFLPSLAILFYFAIIVFGVIFFFRIMKYLKLKIELLKVQIENENTKGKERL